MRQVLGPGALGRPRGIGWRGRWEGGSGCGIHVNPWLIHVSVWQNPLQYCNLISLQLIQINFLKKRQVTWLSGAEKAEVPYSTATLAGIAGSITVSSCLLQRLLFFHLGCVLFCQWDIILPSHTHTHTHSCEKTKVPLFYLLLPYHMEHHNFFQQHFLL